MNCDYYKDPPTLTRNFSTSAVESLKSFKADMMGNASSQDKKQLKTKIRELEEENERLKKDLKTFQGKCYIIRTVSFSVLTSLLCFIIGMVGQSSSSTEDNNQIRALKEENHRLRNDLKFFEGI